MAPEVVQQLPYTQKADVFSFGQLLCEIATQYPVRNVSSGRLRLAALQRPLMRLGGMCALRELSPLTRSPFCAAAQHRRPGETHGSPSSADR